MISPVKIHCREIPFFVLVILVVDLTGEELTAIVIGGGTADAGGNESTVADGEAYRAFTGSTFVRCLFCPQIGCEVILPCIDGSSTVGTGGDICFVACSLSLDHETDCAVANDIGISVVISSGVGVLDITQPAPAFVAVLGRIETPEVVACVANLPLTAGGITCYQVT